MGAAGPKPSGQIRMTKPRRQYSPPEQERQKREACDAILENPDHYPPMAVSWARRFSAEYDRGMREDFRLTPWGQFGAV